MIRKALIIGSPGNRGTDDYLPGVVSDLTNYRAFLQSPEGGAWDDGEIKTLLEPKRDDLALGILLIQRANFGMIIFSGHGRHSSVENTTILRISDGLEYKERDLIGLAKKEILILDCCRKMEAR